MQLSPSTRNFVTLGGFKTVVADDDSQLMLRAARGDSQAFAALFDRHALSVTRFCARFVGNAAWGEELAQDVFLKVFRSAKEYRPTARFKTYLFRVATNHCLNSIRPSSSIRDTERLPDGEEAAHVLAQIPSPETPQHVLEGKEVEAALRRALGQMSDRERAAFGMCRFEGMAYRDIADALEASESAVKSLIHRASLRVVEQLEGLSAAAQIPGVSHGS